MKRHVLNVVEVELVDLDVLSHKIVSNEFNSYYEMQIEDNVLNDYDNPFEYMRDLAADDRKSLWYSN
ncbi:MAG: hypothetical protein LHW64_07480 [Candidatus Cloacimonetes bacterium]|nr:hypothetical protein [Candidatus Cloacimonadota bacterium]MDY0229951.1 hypothetical protein [Candidatus Cloacimonadaceae bacterium]